MERAKARMLQLEVEQLNELERCRLRAQADHEVTSARRRLEQQVEALRRLRHREAEQAEGPRAPKGKGECPSPTGKIWGPPASPVGVTCVCGRAMLGTFGIRFGWF